MAKIYKTSILTVAGEQVVLAFCIAVSRAVIPSQKQGPCLLAVSLCLLPTNNELPVSRLRRISGVIG